MSYEVLTIEDVLSVSDDDLLDFDIFDCDDDAAPGLEVETFTPEQIDRFQSQELAEATKVARQDIRDQRETLRAAGRDFVDEYHDHGYVEDARAWDARAALLGMGANWQDNYEKRVKARETRAKRAQKGRDAVQAVKVQKSEAPGAGKQIKIRKPAPAPKVTFKIVNMSNLAGIADGLIPAGIKNQALIDQYNRGGPGRYQQ